MSQVVSKRDRQARVRTGLVLDVTYFTDPLCCWSWAFEPQWRRLRYEYGDQISWRYRMVGLVEAAGQEPSGALRPEAVVAAWRAARQRSGMPIDPAAWAHAPLPSSRAACIAYKAAEQQSREAADRYLRRLREAVMLQRRDVGDLAVLVALADELAREAPEAFDAARFRQDLVRPAAAAAYRLDRLASHRLGLDRTPALLLRRPDRRSLLLTGFHPYDEIRTALRRVAPELQPVRHALDEESYAAFWGRITGREISEALALRTGWIHPPN